MKHNLLRRMRVRLKKSKIKEWIREDIKSFFLEAEDDDKKDSESDSEEKTTE